MQVDVAHQLIFYDPYVAIVTGIVSDEGRHGHTGWPPRKSTVHTYTYLLLFQGEEQQRGKRAHSRTPNNDSVLLDVDAKAAAVTGARELTPAFFVSTP